MPGGRNARRRHERGIGPGKDAPGSGALQVHAQLPGPFAAMRRLPGKRVCRSASDVQKRSHRLLAGRCPDMQPSSRRPRPDSTRGAQPFRVITAASVGPAIRDYREDAGLTQASSPTGPSSRSRLPSVSRDAPSPQRGPRASGGLLPVFHASDDRPGRCWMSCSRHGIWPAPIIAAEPRGAAIALLSI